MICPHCEHENIDGADVCDECQQPLDYLTDPQPATDLPKGIASDKLSGEQRGILRSLVEEYANSFPPDVSKERMEAIRSGGIENIRFSWAGTVPTLVTTTSMGIASPNTTCSGALCWISMTG